MQCPACQHENRPDARFCAGCGQPFRITCPACSNANAPGSRFCDSCGQALAAPVAKVPAAVHETAAHAYTPAHLAQKVLTTRSALEGARKQVTVMFVDVVGSTSLAEQLDPEEMHSVMARALELMLAEVHRYEGTVNQFLGDGIMALFGAPIAHEDHARRAVLAALAIQRALVPLGQELQRTRRISLQVRQGLNTGLVVVGSIGDDLRMDYTAVGDTTNVAARLQQAAQPGQILISEQTRRLVEGYFQFRTVEELDLKGKEQPVAAWEVLSAQAARGRIDVEADHGLTPFVGRQRELETLLECFERAEAGAGQVALLVGEPGIGKSRLLMELRRRLGDQVTWCEGRSLSYGRGMAFHPLIDMLRRLYRIEETDSEQQIVDKLDQGVARVDPELKAILPYLRYLLSVDPGDARVASMDPQLRRAETFDALHRLLSKAAERRPQVLVYEDLHWIDQATEEHLRFLLDSLPNERILLILSYRPEYRHSFGERSYLNRVALQPLSSEDSGRMADVLIANSDVPEELRGLILRKAEGNPFFVEEVVKSLHEIGALRRVAGRTELTRSPDQIVVPDTIQDVIMARIDRLGEEPKRALQLGAVIGREFARRLFDRLAEIREHTDAVMRELKALELIYEKSLYPELAYMFKHALTQEVTYGSLLLKRRKELHRLIGLAIEDLYAERLAEHYEVLAYHFSRAEQWDKALDYLLKAAQKSARASANREALALYDEALEAVEHLGEAASAQAVAAIHEARASLLMLLSDFHRAHETHVRVLELARRFGDRLLEGRSLAGLGFASVMAHHFDRALAEAQQALAIAQETGDKGTRCAASCAAGWVQYVTGRLEQGQHSMEQVVTLASEIRDGLHGSFARGFLGLDQRWRGDFTVAAVHVAEGVALARRSDQLFALLINVWISGLVAQDAGDYDRAIAAYSESIALCRKAGEEFYYLRNLNSLGWLHMDSGNLDAALEVLQTAAAESRRRGDPETIANAELNLADTHLARRDVPAAGELLEAVQALAGNPKTTDWMRWHYSLHMHASTGEWWLARGDSAKATESVRLCLESARRYGGRKYVARASRLLGEIALARNEPDTALTHLQEALAIAQAIGQPNETWKAHEALARLHVQANRSEQAEEFCRASLAVLEGLQSRTSSPEIHQALAGSPYAERLRSLAHSL
jgi:class 3 adenylate cyclase/tetratricopeptide (TPR) repeat protein